MASIKLKIQSEHSETRGGAAVELTRRYLADLGRLGYDVSEAEFEWRGDSYDVVDDSDPDNVTAHSRRRIETLDGVEHKDGKKRKVKED